MCFNVNFSIILVKEACLKLHIAFIFYLGTINVLHLLNTWVGFFLQVTSLLKYSLTPPHLVPLKSYFL